jgi:subtilisin family serine protease
VSFVPGEDTSDLNGHGTHVASTIVGTSAASGGTYKISLAGNGGSWAGSLPLPHRPGFVSVRASAVTDAGYSIKQEVIRAYGVR